MAAAILAGCGDGSTLEIRPWASLVDSAGLAGLRLDVDGHRLTARDFGRDGGLTEARVDVPNSGELVVLVELRQAGRVAVEGSVRWPMAEGWEWGMDIFRGVEDPLAMCMGCFGGTRLLLPGWAASEEGESLWIAWGGRPKNSDIVY